MDLSTPGFPVLHCLPEFAKTHVHWVSDSIQPSQPLSSPSPVFFPSIRVFSSESLLPDQVAKVLEFQLQHQSFQWIFRVDFLYEGLVGSPCCPRNSRGEIDRDPQMSCWQQWTFTTVFCVFFFKSHPKTELGPMRCVTFAFMSIDDKTGLQRQGQLEKHVPCLWEPRGLQSENHWSFLLKL